MAIESFYESISAEEKLLWGTEKVFRPLSEWNEEDGQVLFFRLDVGEAPEVTSPITSGFDFNYFTHWMPLPKVFGHVNNYRAACIKSEIETTVKPINF